MNEKLSLQMIAEALAQKAGVSKKSADAFSKAFFDTIMEALVAGEEVVKAKGLGTFKLVSVESRESVNVTNGERIVIPGYKKVAFTPEDKVLEVLNGHTENAEQKVEKEAEPVKVEEPIKEDKFVKGEEPLREEESVEEPQDIEALIQVPEPEQVEQLQDAFSGIDMLISTPESVEDIRQQYEDAKAKMETAVEEARKANAEKMRLEKLLERLEKNEAPEKKTHMGIVEKMETPDEPDNSNNSEKSENPNNPEHPESPTPPDPLEEKKRQEAFQRVMGELPRLTEAEQPQEMKKKKWGWVYVFIALFLAVIIFFVYKTFTNIESVQDVPRQEQPVKPVLPTKKPRPVRNVKPVPKVNKDSIAQVARKDSLRKQQKTDSVKVAKEAKPDRPTTHRMQRGESLTRISQKYYGTKDSVRAIIRINTFADPDNVPVGAVVKLP